MEQNEPDHHTSQVPVLCANNCGFFGTAATMNMCSKCYKDIILKQEQEKLAVSSIRSIVNEGSNTDAKESDVTTIIKTNSPSAEIIAPDPQTPSASLAMEKNDEVKGGPKRCATCRKRVGLTGFNCRCGSIFCSVHRYYDKHECPFDYRAAGQEAICQANPVIKAEKLEKI